MELRPYVKIYLRMHYAFCEHVGNQGAFLFIDVLNNLLESDATSADEKEYLIKGLAQESGKGIDSVTSVYFVGGLLNILKRQGMTLKGHELDGFKVSHELFLANYRIISFLPPSNYPLLLDALDEYLDTIGDDIEAANLVLINNLISSEISDGKGIDNIANALENFNVGIFMSSKLGHIIKGKDEEFTFLKEQIDRVVEVDEIIKMAAAYGSEKKGRSIHKPLGTVTTVNKHSLVIGDKIRPLTVNELATAQSFDNDYKWPTSSTAAKTMIGNAVPPLMAKAVVEAFMRAA